ncbi:GNAT family N-acetyltransferase [Demequina mangrovi]|uniref:Predicted acetyltransferase, GNAT family n=1 Tax=Demequina mangrovi TaxID=1043493 RepID=A0A1H6WA17_9MICO|nr:GNAT family N-acetyltransferase [Demequina mangrovi]SEJ12024.1 Predicted acetyltransferase, GNAT family [Demequina mangrovi]
MNEVFELDHPVWYALNGPQRRLAVTQGRAARLPTTIGPFAAVPPDATAQDWADLAEIAGTDTLVLFGAPREVPPEWAEVETFAVAQMAAPEDFGRLHDGIERLAADDAQAMLDIVTETEPGPFATETYRTGAYYGIREGERLVALAGERLVTPSWTEISAVCTRDSHRGRGLATRLMEVVAHGIREAGRQPFLHTGAGNAAAIRLYEHLGFTHRTRDNVVQLVQAPGVEATPLSLH